MIESSLLSICREFSLGADNADAYGEAFGITLASREEIPSSLPANLDQACAALLASDFGAVALVIGGYFARLGEHLFELTLGNDDSAG